MNLVLDASAVMGWHIVRQDPNEAAQAQHALRAVMANGAIVPALWYQEIANALLHAERYQSFTLNATTAFLADLASLPIATDTASPVSTQAPLLALARAFHLTAYDASYLELAIRKTAKLATFDRRLAEAARSAGVPVFGDPA